MSQGKPKFTKTKRISQRLALATIMLTGLGSMAIAGTLEVTPQARFVGDYGLRVHISDATPAYVQDDHPQASMNTYKVRFYFRAVDLELGAGDRFSIFSALDSSSTPQFSVVVVNDSGTRKLHFLMKTNSGEVESNPALDPILSGGWHAVELHWTRDNADGRLETWIDGMAGPALTGVDNSSSTMESVRWGAVDGVDAQTSGMLDLDLFDSRRTETIGTHCFSATDFQNAMDEWAVKNAVHYLVTLINHRCTP